MRASLEKEDIELIISGIMAQIKPLLQNSRAAEPDTVMDVSGLAEYLGVDSSWLYKQVQLKNIPYFKCGKYTKFKKSQIDKWIEQQTIKPVPLMSLARSRG